MMRERFQEKLLFVVLLDCNGEKLCIQIYKMSQNQQIKSLFSLIQVHKYKLTFVNMKLHICKHENI